MFAALAGRLDRSDTDRFSARPADRRKPLPAGDEHRRGGLYLEGFGKPPPRFLNGLLYTLGRVATYTLLGAVLIAVLRAGASVFAIQKAIGKWGEMLIAPALILIGLFMLFGHRLNLPNFGFSGRGERMGRGGGWGALLLGILFSLAFCPTSGVFYFGMLIPMSAAETGGYLLPAVFAVATGLPVVIVAWLLAYSVAGLGAFYNRMQAIQKWLSRIVGLLL